MDFGVVFMKLKLKIKTNIVIPWDSSLHSILVYMNSVNAKFKMQ